MDQEKDAAPVWWLEGSSYPIEVIDKEKVKVLVRSDELKRRYKHDPVIISFEWGKGVVYHMISHFYLQRSEIRTQKQGMKNYCLPQCIDFINSHYILKLQFNITVHVYMYTSVSPTYNSISMVQCLV